jgi:hypothetical protein
VVVENSKNYREPTSRSKHADALFLPAMCASIMVSEMASSESETRESLRMAEIIAGRHQSRNLRRAKLARLQSAKARSTARSALDLLVESYLCEVRTFRISDPAPETPDIQPRRDRGIRCSQFVELEFRHTMNLGDARAPPCLGVPPGKRAAIPMRRAQTGLRVSTRSSNMPTGIHLSVQPAGRGSVAKCRPPQTNERTMNRAGMIAYS